jgi:hypothetical protein
VGSLGDSCSPFSGLILGCHGVAGWASRLPGHGPALTVSEEAAVVLEERLTGRPWFPISLLEEDGNLERFLEVLEWMVEEVVGRED